MVYNKLSNATKRLFILADSTFGSCCVDLIAAKHVNADLVIHYGRACLGHTSINVLYIFGKSYLNIDVFVEKKYTQI